MITFFWIFVITGVALVGMVILPRRHYFTWGWNVMLVLVIAYFGLYKLTGAPRSACLLSSLTGLKGDYQVLYHNEITNKAIYLLLQVDSAPLLVETNWTKGRETSLRKATMQAEKQGAVLMVRAELLSQCSRPDSENDRQGHDNGLQNQRLDDRDGANAPKRGTEGGDPTFYAKPVDADPFKTLPPQTVIEVH